MAGLLRISEVADRLSITVPRAYELIRRGIIPSVAIGRLRRVDPRALEAFITGGGKPIDEEATWPHGGS